MHTDAPIAPEYVPTIHGVHAAVPPAPTPSTSLYVPAAHAVHTAPSVSPLYPGKHLQLEISSLPGAELVPRGHAVQPPGPVSGLYVPVPHALHALQSAPVYPAEHVQSVALMLPVSEYRLVPQGVQSPLVVVSGSK